jgi:phosphoribosylformylglycinamidine synthase subunit PurQ / glutaminase
MSERPCPRIAVVVFPGSNDDRDAALALEGLGAEPVLVWHAEPELPEVGAVVLPGGFSYGDYLRCGAIARFAPVMDAVRRFADEGGLVLGICNGFQVLCEAGLLPGALLRNVELRFICKQVELEANGQVVLRYEDNPNGSIGDIAGVANREGNVFGLMPHPEHAVDPLLGSEDGALVLGSLLDAVRERLLTTA